MVVSGLSVLGFLALPARRKEPIHAFGGWVLQLLQQCLQRASSPLKNDLLLCTRLIAAVRAGLSLESACEALLQEERLAPPIAMRLRSILAGRPQPHTLDRFLHSAWRSGISVLTTLENFRKILSSEHKLQLKAQAVSSQARAQASVLAWLPWVFLLIVGIFDFSWFTAAIESALSWLLWGFAIVLSSFGKKWMESSLANALSPASPTEKFEEKILPVYALALATELSLGRDPFSAASSAQQDLRSPQLDAAIEGKIPSKKLKECQQLVQFAADTGAPLKRELLAFTQDLYAELESRWEERVLRLPVALLAPLFLCFFPSTLLTLAGLILPLFQELL